MIASALAGSLRSSAARRWRSLRLRARVALALVTLAIASGAWFGLASRFDPWPARVVLKTPPYARPLAFSPDGRAFLTSGSNSGGKITVWDTTTGLELMTWPVEDKLGEFPFMGTFSPDGRTFAVAIRQGDDPLTIKLIDTTEGRTRLTIKPRHSSAYQLDFSPDGREIRAFLGGKNGLKEVVTWDAENGEPRSSRVIGPPLNRNLMAISRDFRVLASKHSRNSRVQIWDLDGSSPIGSLDDPSIGYGHREIDFSPDGFMLGVARGDGGIDLWDVPGRTFLKTLAVHSGNYRSQGFRFSPEGRTLASTGWNDGSESVTSQIRDLDVVRKVFGAPKQSEDYEMVVVDIATGNRIGRAPRSMLPRFSPDGRSVATVSTPASESSVKLRTLATPQR